MFKKIVSKLSSNPWKAYAQSIDAEYIDGGFLKSDQIVLQKSFYKIFISLGTNQRGNAGFVYTRFRCAYISSQPLYFSIKPHFFLSKLWFAIFSSRNQSASIGNYIVKANTKESLQVLLHQKELWLLLKQLPSFKFYSEKNDGIYGPEFLEDQHQICLELLREVKTAQEFDKALAVIDFTIDLLLKQGFLSAQETIVLY